MRLRVAPLLAAALLGGVWISAQTPDNQPRQAPVRSQFFAGTITSLTDQQVTVSRTAVGRSPEHRTFVINPKTKMNRSALKLKTRVTVRYQHLDQGDVALEIQLQPSTRSPRPS